MKKKGKNPISGVKVMKKDKQRGGLAALNISNINKHRTPKIFIGLSKQYLRKQNESVEDLMDYIKNILIEHNKEESYLLIKDLLKNNNRVSRYSIKENRIFLSAWVQGPPTYDLYQKNEFQQEKSFDTIEDLEEDDSVVLETYNIDIEEKASLSLLTLDLDFSSENITYSLHHNGIVISIHAIARLIQRMGYQSQHIDIKKEIDQIIPWASIKTSLVANGLPYMRQLLTPSENGVWCGSLCIIPDRARENSLSPVYFVKTFLSKGLMTDNQLERLKDLCQCDDILTPELYLEVDVFLETLKPPSENVALPGLIKILDAKDDFYSKDKLIDRVEETLNTLNIDYNKVMSGGITKQIFLDKFSEYRMVEKSHI